MGTLSNILITLYQRLISPFLPQSCRFYPTCSEYCKESIERHGWFRGLILGAKRMLRCHPWGGQGEDPVPPITHHTH